VAQFSGSLMTFPPDQGRVFVIRRHRACRTCTY
jgi:hypothetical protein